MLSQARFSYAFEMNRKLRNRWTNCQSWPSKMAAKFQFKLNGYRTRLRLYRVCDWRVCLQMKLGEQSRRCRHEQMLSMRNPTLSAINLPRRTTPASQSNGR